MVENATVPRVQLALERESARLCSPVALSVATLLCGYSLFHLALYRETSGEFVAPWIASAILLAVVGLWTRRHEPKHGHAVLSGIALVGVLNALSFLVIVRDPIYTTMILLVLLGHAILAMHAGWHVLVSTPALLGWVAIAATDPYPGDWVAMGVLLASGVAVAGLAQILRVQDRTRLEKARAEAVDGEARLRALGEAAFEGVALHDRGTLLLVNPAFARLLGYRPEELVGRHALDLVAPASRAVVEARLAMVDDAPYEILLQRRDGSSFHAEVAARDFPYEGRTVRVTTARDITERKAAAAASAERDRLRALHDVRSRFINDAAHQLNTPLTPIKLSAHLLARGTLGPLTQKQASAIGTIQRNVEQLAALSKMLLDTTSLDHERGLRAEATTDIAAPLQDAVAAHAERAKRIGVRVVVEPVPTLMVHADGARLGQALRGLVGELLDAAAPGTTIAVGVRSAGSQAEVHLRRDPPADAPGETRARTDAAEHLYVDLARRLVAPHGGTLEARAEGASREYALGLRLVAPPRPSTRPTSF